MAATILHADLDAFYASVEQLLDPSLRGKPVAVGGGVVLAASYEARAFGVRGGMSGATARELCPGLLFVGGHFDEYQRLGDAVMAVFEDFTPHVERISIDEAFLEVAGSIHLFGSPATMAATIRRRVRDELGLPVSIGVATTKHLAKVASQVAKPDGLLVVEDGTERTFLGPLPVRLLWGVGPATEERLGSAGIRTVGELAAASPESVTHLIGKANGRTLSERAVNVDPRRIEGARRAHSVGAQSALGRAPATPVVLRTTLGFLADRVAARLREGHRAGRTVTVRVRFPGMRSVTRSITLPAPLCSTLTLTDVGVDLAQGALDDNPHEREVTLLAVSVSQLVDDAAVQLSLPFERPPESARWAVDEAVDRVRGKYGRASVGYAAVALSDVGNVPDAFRELAER